MQLLIKRRAVSSDDDKPLLKKPHYLLRSSADLPYPKSQITNGQAEMSILVVDENKLSVPA